MIIWISGAYGVGKSTVAEKLAQLLPDASVFDAEEVGNAVRGNYPGEPYGVIFEDYPLWAEFCCRLLADIHPGLAPNVIVPMTLVRPESYERIIARLKAEGHDVLFAVLEASLESIRERILARGEEEDCWCMQNIDMAISRTHEMACGIHIDTDGVSPDIIAEMLLGMLKTAPGAFVRC